MKETEGFAVVASEGFVVGAGGLQKDEGAFDVGAEEDVRAEDRAVDVAFGGEVEDGARPVLVDDAGYESGVGDVAMDEDVIRGVGNGSEIFGVAGVGELVEVDERAETGG